MKNYSIVRVGNEYVVQADEKSVLKTSSRRRAAKTVTDATGLLEHQAPPQAPTDTPDEPLMGCDAGEISDSSGHT